jgi:hypothetical protein
MSLTVDLASAKEQLLSLSNYLSTFELQGTLKTRGDVKPTDAELAALKNFGASMKK